MNLKLKIKISENIAPVGEMVELKSRKEPSVCVYLTFFRDAATLWKAFHDFERGKILVARKVEAEKCVKQIRTNDF